MAGPGWARKGPFVVTARRGATLVALGVTGLGVSLVAAMCSSCGSVRVSWVGTARTVSLPSQRPGARVASKRRVAIDALVVARG